MCYFDFTITFQAANGPVSQIYIKSNCETNNDARNNLHTNYGNVTHKLGVLFFLFSLAVLLFLL